MKLIISFDKPADMDRFYQDILQDNTDDISKIHANTNPSEVYIELKLNNFANEKVFVNNVKQYMRDNEINYNIKVA